MFTCNLSLRRFTSAEAGVLFCFLHGVLRTRQEILEECEELLKMSLGQINATPVQITGSAAKQTAQPDTMAVVGLLASVLVRQGKTDDALELVIGKANALDVHGTACCATAMLALSGALDLKGQKEDAKVLLHTASGGTG